jgi:hypothetical protein
MFTLDTKTSLYTEDRGIQVPMVLDHDYIPHTYKHTQTQKTSEGTVTSISRKEGVGDGDSAA